MQKRKHKQTPLTNKNNKYEHLSTLCWCCANATNDGCEWSADFEPVPGWEAIPTKINSKVLIQLPNGQLKNKDRLVDSFKVIKCPKFIEDIDPKQLGIPQTTIRELNERNNT